MSSTIETMFSVGSVQIAYKRSDCSDRVSSRAVESPREFLVEFQGSRVIEQ
jgi:hypothetical protein